MLTLSPSTSPTKAVVGIPSCFEGSGIVVLPQTPEAAISIPSSGTHFTFNSTTKALVKSSGSFTYTDCTIIADDTVYGLQPFYIKGCNSSNTSASGDVSWYIGVLDDNDVGYQIELFRYGTLSGWFMKVYGPQGAMYQAGVHFNEIFYIRSDGIYLYFEHVDAGILRRDVSIQLPSTLKWRFQVGVGGVGNEIDCLSIYKGSYQGSVPITWTNPDGGTLNVTGNTACLTGSSSGTYSICVDSDFDDPVCVEIDVAPLTFDPINIGCGGCVFTDTVVDFTSNGGLAGTLVAIVDGLDIVIPTGTVINALTWQAPSTPTTASITYIIGGESVTCVLNVIDKLKVLNVVGDTITGLVPGDTFQILTNYEPPNIIWENLSCPNVVTATGVVSIPRRLNDDCFGALDCYIRGRLVTIPDQSCTNLTTGEDQVIIDLHVISDPIYPTPEFGGPTPLKWKPETPDYRVLINEFEGGCDETYLRNRVGIHKWTINYNGLIYKSESPCPPEPCCDEEQGFIDGFDSSFQTAKRLDDFWNLVAGTSGYFTLKDMRTGVVWKKVRFDAAMERDHINWHRTHSRTANLVWHPCCATYPLGGVCVHDSTITDTFPPTVPQHLTVDAVSYSELFIHWDSSIDAIGVKGYILSVDGDEFDLGNALSYQHKGLSSASTHEYRVKAYDFSGNISSYSSSVYATTPYHDITPPLVPNGLTAAAVNAGRIDLSWTNAGDDVATTGYFLLLDGIAVNVGNVTSYSHTGLLEATSHTYSVRAYDAAGNRSAWSPNVSATTFPVFVNGIVLGNSMTIIPSPDNVTWWGNWGMAASTRANDFVHRLTSLAGTYSPSLVFAPFYCLDWELNYSTFNYSLYDGYFLTNPDLIIIRLGENVANLETHIQQSNYQAALVAFINYCKSKAPNATIILSGNYWEGDISVKDPIHYAAAKACNIPFTSFEYLDTADNRSFIGAVVSGDDSASHTVEDGAVAHHPADGGHLAMAQEVYNTLYDPTPKLISYKIDAGRTSGGVVSGYNVETNHLLLGSSVGISMSVNTSLITDPPPTSIWNTRHYAFHQHRYGKLEPNVPYKIELFTAEDVYTSAGQRTFSIAVNGIAKSLTGPAGTVSNYDAWAQAGGVQNKGTAATCTALSSVGGWITIDFSTSNDGQIMGSRLTKVG